jgi:hypothetical protein
LVACGSASPDTEEPPGDPAIIDDLPSSVLGAEAAGPLPAYQLAMRLNPSAHRLTGREQVTYPNRARTELTEIVLRLYPNLPQYGGLMEIGPTWVDGQPSTASLRADRTSLVVPLRSPLPPQASATISLTFAIDIPQKNGNYVLFGHSEGIWSLPDAYPLLAVHDGLVGLSGSGTGWHEDLAPPHGDAVFAEAAFYDVTLIIPSGLTLAATGSIVSDVEDGMGYRMYQIRGGPLREFAWLSGANYQIAETVASGARVRSYYLRGDETAGRAALNGAAAALRLYGEVFGPYPFPEMTVVEAPLGPYGMEYPSLNLIGLDLYRRDRQELETRLAHEIAHQWWYAQVGNDQVNTPWLDEGLAEHSTATYYREILGEKRADAFIAQRWLVPYQAAVEEGYDTVVDQPSAAFGPEYEVIVYAKAALFFEALRSKLGDDVYASVLRTYVDRYRWRIATPDEFLRLAESVSGQDLTDLYNRWILSSE